MTIKYHVFTELKSKFSLFDFINSTVSVIQTSGESKIIVRVIEDTNTRKCVSV